MSRPVSESIRLKDGVVLPRLGQGTWRIGDQPAKRAEEIAALRHGVELGMNLIDTAEMYGGRPLRGAWLVKRCGNPRQRISGLQGLSA